jgi:hypothetical protein
LIKLEVVFSECKIFRPLIKSTSILGSIYFCCPHSVQNYMHDLWIIKSNPNYLLIARPYDSSDIILSNIYSVRVSLKTFLNVFFEKQVHFTAIYLDIAFIL